MEEGSEGKRFSSSKPDLRRAWVRLITYWGSGGSTECSGKLRKDLRKFEGSGG